MVGAVVTLGGAIIANVFVLAKMYVETKLATMAAQEASAQGHQANRAIQKVAATAEATHDAVAKMSAVTQIEEFKAETSAARQSAEKRLEEIRGGGV